MCPKSRLALGASLDDQKNETRCMWVNLVKKMQLEKNLWKEKNVESNVKCCSFVKEMGTEERGEEEGMEGDEEGKDKCGMKRIVESTNFGVDGVHFCP